MPKEINISKLVISTIYNAWYSILMILPGLETHLFEIDKRVGFGYLSQDALKVVNVKIDQLCWYYGETGLLPVFFYLALKVSNLIYIQQHFYFYFCAYHHDFEDIDQLPASTSDFTKATTTRIAIPAILSPSLALGSNEHIVRDLGVAFYGTRPLQATNFSSDIPPGKG